jgi:ribosomal protein S18 acetylase RimI-like enzyme
MWSRAGELLRENGVRQLWFRALGELGYRRQLVTELLLPADPVDGPQPPDTEARFLGDADLDAYAALRGASGRASERLARGDRCFGIWLAGRLVSTRWVARGTVRLAYVDRDAVLGPTDVYFYDVYTAPQHRRRGISRFAAGILPELLASEGARRIVGVLEPENRAAIAANEMAGYRVVGRIGYAKLGPWRRDFGEL